MKRENLRIIGIEESKDSQLKRSAHLQQNYGRKVPEPKERDAHKHTRSLQNTKQLGQCCISSNSVSKIIFLQNEGREKNAS